MIKVIPLSRMAQGISQFAHEVIDTQFLNNGSVTMDKQLIGVAEVAANLWQITVNEQPILGFADRQFAIDGAAAFAVSDPEGKLLDPALGITLISAGGTMRMMFGEPSDESWLGWREHDTDRVRVWKNGWGDDMFEILPRRAIADLILAGYTVKRPLGVCEDYYTEEDLA